MSDSSTSALLLKEAQAGLPLRERPFLELGERVGLSEEQVINSLREHLDCGLIREISGIFDSGALGFSSTLAAMQVPEQQLDRAAAVVSAHPRVSHNYSRKHKFSLWFTLTVPPGVNLDEELEKLVSEAGGWHYRSFPALRVFKIGVQFDLDGGGASSAGGYVKPQTVEVTGTVQDAVRAMQQPAPLVSRPFEEMAQASGLSAGELLEQAGRLAECGALRRWAAVLRHRQAGFSANVMSAWDASGGELEQLAEALSELPSVSHCYERPAYPDWPYRLFAMLHARSPGECEAAVREVAERAGVRKFVLLESVHEYKKQRVRLFG